MSEDAAIVLAAGKGTRMRSQLPKVLHAVAGRSMIERVLDSLQSAGFPSPTVVVGYGADLIRKEIENRSRCVDQGKQLGTGHAARVGLEYLPDSVERVLIVHGDEPLIPADVYLEMLRRAAATRPAIVLLTTHVNDTREFGRVVRNEAGTPVGLLQQADLMPDQLGLDEVNLGAYVFDARFLRARLRHLEPHASKGEYYLTDAVAIAVAEGKTVEALTIEGGETLMGVNELSHLERASHAIYRATSRRLMETGVTIVDTSTTFIEDGAQVEPDTVIHPFTYIRGHTTIGGSCVIGPHTHILSSQIGQRCEVLSSTVSESVVADDVRIGPYAHLREGACIGSGAEIGSHAEIKGSIVGSGSKMHHFGYLGDARVGKDVNIGAGTVTCNFDGSAKHETVIEDRAFIGSDTMLRAPVSIGEGAYTGAGSVVTADVPSGATVAGVPARIIKEGAQPAHAAEPDDGQSSGAQARRGS